jgi:uncharacterized protein (TIGR02300 family)
MPKPEWGVKRACASCGARFYDLMNDPIICPDCGATFVIETAKPGRRRAAEPVARREQAEDVELVEEDADVLDEDDDSDDDVAVEAAATTEDEDEETLEPDDSVLLEDESDDEDLSEFGDESEDDDRR